EITQLILDQNHFQADGQILVGIGFCIESDRCRPSPLFGRRKICWPLGCSGNSRGRASRRALQPRLTIKCVVQIEPEATVKLVDRKRRRRRFHLSTYRGAEKQWQTEGKPAYAAHQDSQWAHEKNEDGSAKLVEAANRGDSGDFGDPTIEDSNLRWRQIVIEPHAHSETGADVDDASRHFDLLTIVFDQHRHYRFSWHGVERVNVAAGAAEIAGARGQTSARSSFGDVYNG